MKADKIKHIPKESSPSQFVSNVLIIGARLGLVEACTALGLNVTVINNEIGKIASSNQSGIEVLLVERLDDTERMIYTLLNYGKQRIDAVCTGYEDAIFTTAILQAFYQTQHAMSLRTAAVFRDKLFQKQHLKGIVRHAKGKLIQDFHAMPVLDDLTFPLILKPSNGVATSFTYVVRDSTALQEVIELLTTQDHDQYPAFILEEFLHGEEWHLNGWVSNGTVQWFSASKYGEPLIKTKEGVVVSSINIVREDDESLFCILESFLNRSLDALGLTAGVFHLECFLKDGAFYFSECAARIGGGYVAETIYHMYDINLYEVAVRLACGVHVTAPTAYSPRGYFGYIQLPAPDKPKLYIPTVEDFLVLPGVVQAEYEFKVGDDIPDVTKSSSAKAGKVIVKASSEQRLRVAFGEILQYARRPYSTA